MLSDTQLDALLEELKTKICVANRNGSLDELLKLLGMNSYLEPEDTLETYKEGKIVVIGGTEVKEKESSWYR